MIRLHLFGNVDLRNGGGTEIRSVLAQPKRTALLAYLATAKPGAFTSRRTRRPGRPLHPCSSGRFYPCPPRAPDAQLAAAREAARLAPGSIWNGATGVLLLRRGRPHEALEYLEQIDPEHGWARNQVMYWNLLHRAYHTLGEYSDELEAARRYRALAPDVTGGVGLEALALVALGRTREAEDSLYEALRQPPNRSFALPLDLARAAAREMRAHGEPEAAGRVTERGIAWARSPVAEEWIAIRPAREQADARRAIEAALGDLLYDAGRREDAQAAMEDRASREPMDLTARLVLGKLAADRGDTVLAERAIRFFTDHRDFQPASVVAALLGDERRALQYLWDAQRRADIDYLWLHRDPAWDSLRNDPAFQELMRPAG